MRAGLLGRHRITIEQQDTGTANAGGEIIPTWSDYAVSVPVEILPQRGREFYQAQQVQAEITHLIRIRYLPGVTSKMRAIFGTRTLHILDVRNVDERSREMLLMCKEST
ncbi:hypothetical protein LCGC14_2797540 [marine sediment metagenome]|uniref:Phage head-tail adaptor n=1 Tax=marine sediment metagenome TaxID=412755 RepID=A0A0F8YNN6_9ZZZZ